MDEDDQQENRHHFSRMKWQDDLFGAVREVVTEEADGTRPAPLSLKDDVITVVVDIDQETTAETSCRNLRGSRRHVCDSTQCNRRREMSSRHHDRYSRTRTS